MQRKPKLAAPRAFRREPASIPDIHFPPGRPTSSNIKLVCKLRKLRPRYVASCLPRGGYGWLARQSKAINRLERGLKRCCKGKKDVLACADEKVTIRATKIASPHSATNNIPLAMHVHVLGQFWTLFPNRIRPCVAIVMNMNGGFQ